MAKKNNKSALTDITSIDREPYSPPSLREFGPVGALTHGGTAGIAEGQMKFMGQNRMA